MNKFLKYSILAAAWLMVIGLLSFVNRTEEPKEITVEITTTYGVMKLKLYNETPLHRDNFIKLVNEQYYDSLLFHRVISQFMIQGGDPDSKNAPARKQLGEGGPGYEIDAEFNPNLFHRKGALAAAREGDNVNPQKKSAGSQFYIVQGQVFDSIQLQNLEQRRLAQYQSYEFKKCMNEPLIKELLDRYLFSMRNGVKITTTAIMNDMKPTVDERLEYYKFSPEQIEVYSTVGGTPHLDMAYTVFGQLIEGWDVLDSISAVAVDKNNRPLEDVIMSIRIVE
jgi:cyclophilin family peptidyl-prolyl cis-trans isomerase